VAEGAAVGLRAAAEGAAAGGEATARRGSFEATAVAGACLCGCERWPGCGASDAAGWVGEMRAT